MWNRREVGWEAGGWMARHSMGLLVIVSDVSHREERGQLVCYTAAFRSILCGLQTEMYQAARTSRRTECTQQSRGSCQCRRLCVFVCEFMCVRVSVCFCVSVSFCTPCSQILTSIPVIWDMNTHTCTCTLTQSTFTHLHKHAGTHAHTHTCIKTHTLARRHTPTPLVLTLNPHHPVFPMVPCTNIQHTAVKLRCISRPRCGTRGYKVPEGTVKTQLITRFHHQTLRDASLPMYGPESKENA